MTAPHRCLGPCAAALVGRHPLARYCAPCRQQRERVLTLARKRRELARKGRPVRCPGVALPDHLTRTEVAA